jgi:hypothetical protein
MKRTSLLLSFGSAFILAGCPSSKRAPKSDGGAEIARTSTAAAPVKTATTARMMHTGQRFRECYVYLDGTPVGALAWGELPPNVTTMWHTIKDGRKYRRYGFHAYLEGLGVDMKKLKEVHLYGGRTRTCIVPGEEVRKFKDRIQVAFTQSKRGQPLVYWPPKIKINDSIDKISRIAIYVNKRPPKWNQEESVLELDGELLEDGEIPYSTTEMRSGARVYIDGLLVAVLKRNKIEQTKSSSVAEKNPPVPLLAHLEAIGKKTSVLSSADIVDEDIYVGHVEKKDLPKLSFALIDNSGGEVLMHPLEQRATAILLSAKRKPPDFSLR